MEQLLAGAQELAADMQDKPTFGDLKRFTAEWDGILPDSSPLPVNGWTKTRLNALRTG